MALARGDRVRRHPGGVPEIGEMRGEVRARHDAGKDRRRQHAHRAHRGRVLGRTEQPRERDAEALRGDVGARRLEAGERLPAVAAVAVLEPDAREPAREPAAVERVGADPALCELRGEAMDVSSMPCVSPRPTSPSSVSTSTSVRSMWSVMYIALT